MSDNIELYTVIGADIEPFIDDLARLRIEIFREFPYLYDGDMAYERDYLRAYSQSAESVFILAKDAKADGQIVGAATGIPIADAESSLQQPFREQGYNPDTVFYFGESVLLPAYRGKGIGVSFLEMREHYVRKLERFIWICFCAVERSVEHPLRPPNYIPLNQFWQKRGYTKHPKLKTTYTWKQVDESAPSPKPMRFWLKAVE